MDLVRYVSECAFLEAMGVPQPHEEYVPEPVWVEYGPRWWWVVEDGAPGLEWSVRAARARDGHGRMRFNVWRPAS